MLKKLLKGLFVVWISLIPVSFSNWYFNEVYVYQPNESFYCYDGNSHNVSAYVDENLNFHSTINWNDFNWLWYYFKGTTDSWSSYIIWTYGRSNTTWWINAVWRSQNWNTRRNRIATSFLECDFNIENATTSLTNCNLNDPTVTYENFITIMNSNTFDNFIITDRCNSFCFYSDSYWKAFCQHLPDDNSNSIYLFNTQWNSNIQYNNLTEFATDNANAFNNSPFRRTTKNTINEYSCPTIQQLLNTYWNEYTTNLCYSSNLIYSWWTIQTVTPKSIFTLYPTLTDFTQDIWTYNSYCNNASTTTACQTMFENKEEKYTLIAKIPNNVEPFKLYQYCNLALNYDPSQTTCTASWTINTNTWITINDIITEIGEENYTVVTPWTPPPSIWTGNGTGSVYDNLITDENDTQWRNVVQNAKNIIQTMKELYAKITWIFRWREWTQWIIPRYITSIILLIVLFKLFKK